MLNKIAKIILKNPRLILSIIFLLTIYFAYTAFFSGSKLEVDFSLEQMFPNDDVDRDYYESFLKEFGQNENIILVAYLCDSLLSKTNIEKMALLTEEFEFIDGVENVFSLSNLPIGYLQDYNITQQEWDAETDHITNHPFYSNIFLSHSGNAGSILIHLNEEITNHDDRSIVVNEIENILDNSTLEYHLAGIPVMRTKYVQLVIHERMIFLPIAFLVVILVLTFTFRQIKGVVIPLIAISTTLIWVAGLMAIFGITINVISYLTFNLLMIIGVSDAIHLFIKYHEELNKNLTQHYALINVINDIGSALFLTSFTTAVGFFSLVLTNIQITKEFGVTLGLGVILLFILTIIIMPALLSLIEIPDKVHIKRLIVGERLQTAEKLNMWNRNHPKTILLISGFIIVTSIFGLTKMDYNATLMDDLKEGNTIYNDIKFVENELGGTLPLEIVIRNTDLQKVLTLSSLQNLEKMSEFISSIPEIGSVVSIVDYLKLKHEIIEGSYELPQAESIESYLINLESNLLSSDNNFRISARVKNISTKRAEEIKNNILKMSKIIFDDSFEVGVTGTTLLALKTNKHLVSNLTTSFIVAFIIIFFSMILLFKSVRLSLLSILPNILPLLVAGGIMGFLGIKLRPSTAMTFSIALGITVDDTIHFLSRFRKEFKLSGNHNIATERTLLTTGKAIINTTIILGMGFFVLVFSKFVPNEEFGLLATIIIIFALISSIVLLPVLIHVVKPKFRFKM